MSRQTQAGEQRLDAYILRRWGATDPDGVQVRDYWGPDAGTFVGQRWYVQQWAGGAWVRLGDLMPGERPAMRDGYCWIVTREEATR